MKQFQGYDEAKKAAQYSGGAKLPAGAYVCNIIGVKPEEGKGGYSDMIHMHSNLLSMKKVWQIICRSGLFVSL